MLDNILNGKKASFYYKNVFKNSSNNQKQKVSNNYNIQRIGYARISTDDQFLNLQKDALKKADCLIIYEEIASGKKDKRVYKIA